MIIEAPFTFVARKVLRRRETLESSVGSVSVSVPEFDGAVAPVAFKWAAGVPGNEGRFFVRIAEGVLYQPVETDSTEESDPNLFSSDGPMAMTAAAFSARVGSSRFAPRLQASPRPRAAETAPDLPFLRSGIRPDEAARAGALSKSLGECRVIGGVVHRAISFPIVKNFNFGGLRLGSWRDFATADKIHAEYRLDRFDDVLSSVADPGLAGIFALKRPEVLIPEAVAFDEHAYLLKRADSFLRARFAKHRKLLCRLGDDAITSYVAARDAAAAEDWTAFSAALEVFSRSCADTDCSADAESTGRVLERIASERHVDDDDAAVFRGF
jgi:hypothetical protein